LQLDPIISALGIRDTIAQKLFTASLIADVLPRLWEINPTEGRVRLNELRELTRGLIMEMQYLMDELRCIEDSQMLLIDGSDAKGGSSAAEQD
jgi:signal transduction histidine kinase